MDNNSGFDPIADTLAVLSQLEPMYFIPVVIIFLVLILTGTFKRRFPVYYEWKRGNGFKRVDMKAKFNSLPAEQQERLKSQFDEIKG